MMHALEDNSSRADMYVQSFIAGTDWADEVAQLDRMEKITKQDVVEWANKYLAENGYVIVFKREGEDKSVQKIAAPKITPIATNRDQQSAFLTEIQQSEVTPIEPVFVDYQKEMAQFDVRDGIHVLYKKNELNDIFTLNYVFDTGTENDPTLALAFNYLSYLGTVHDGRADRLGDVRHRLLVLDGSRQQPEHDFDLGTEREHAPGNGDRRGADRRGRGRRDHPRKPQAGPDQVARRCQAQPGPEFRSPAALHVLRRGVHQADHPLERSALGTRIGRLIAAVRDLMNKQHEVLYYGPMSEEQVKASIAERHKAAEVLTPLEKSYPKRLLTDKSSVVVAQYDANQLYYLQFSNRGELFDVKNDPAITLYNEYFGGSMNSICFQEMREARGLAYTAQAWIGEPSFADDNYSYIAFIATQNDKMQTAIEAFDEIINQMPESGSGLPDRQRGHPHPPAHPAHHGAHVLNSYLSLRRLGLTEDRDRQIFEKVQAMTLDDVKATQQQWVKGRPYTYGILGDIKNLDLNYLKTLGPIRTVSQEEIFGY